jgi:G3E family GTPase
MAKIPITVVTGYLGAGKTTLLRRLLDEATALGLRLAIVMNEFGEIGIDGAVLKGKAIDIVELAGGCVCCSMTGEFEAALAELAAKSRPDHVVVETTGVAEPDAIVVDLQSLDGFRLDAVVTVADADALIRFPTIGHTGTVQLEMADLVLLNKSDLVSGEQLEQMKAEIQTINPRATIVPAVRCAVAPELVLGVGGAKGKKAPSAKADHDHTQVESFSIVFDGAIAELALTDFANGLPPQVYRAKGFVNLDDGRTVLFSYVAGRWETEEWETAEKSRLVFIGEGVLALKEMLESSLYESVEG